MKNKVKLMVVEYVGDNRVKVELNDKKYTRTIRKSISDQKYIVINGNEYLV